MPQREFCGSCEKPIYDEHEDWVVRVHPNRGGLHITLRLPFHLSCYERELAERRRQDALPTWWQRLWGQT